MGFSSAFYLNRVQEEIMCLNCPQFLVLLCVSWGSPDQLAPVVIPSLPGRCSGGTFKVGLGKLWARLSASHPLEWGGCPADVMLVECFPKITSTMEAEDLSTPCTFMGMKCTA